MTSPGTLLSRDQPLDGCEFRVAFGSNATIAMPVLRADVRFAPEAAAVLRRRSMSRWAIKRHSAQIDRSSLTSFGSILGKEPDWRGHDPLRPFAYALLITPPTGVVRLLPFISSCFSAPRSARREQLSVQL